MKTVIVTRAARGIGLATTKRFLSDRYKATMVDWDKAELEHASKSLENVLTLPLDISQPAHTERIIQ